MGELVKYLIERLAKRPIASEALVVVSIIAICFTLIQYFYENPQAVIIFLDYRFQSIVVVVASFWIASLFWRYAKIKTLKLISAFAIVVSGISVAGWIVSSSKIEQTDMRIIFDESVEMPPEAMSKLIEILQSPLYNVEISDTPIIINGSSDTEITDTDIFATLKAKDYISGYIPKDSSKSRKFTAFITGKNLSDSDWNNLLYIAWPEAVVISIWGIGNTNSLLEKPVRQYVAASIAYQTIVSNALNLNKDILEERPSDIIKNCLHDFSKLRASYILQSQSPKLCDAEAESIRKIFGRPTEEVLNDIFAKIRNDS